MAAESNFAQPCIPKFDGDYEHWSMLMENLLRSKEYWSVIESGYVEPATEAVLTGEQKKALEEKKLKDLKAKNYLFQSIDKSILKTIAQKETSKQIWDSMKIKYQGNARVQRAQLQILRRNFEVLEMKPGESVTDYFSRVMLVANDMRNAGENMPDVKIVEKILRTLTEKFNYIVCSIEESKDINLLTVDDLQSSLLVHEQKFQKSGGEDKALRVYDERFGSRGRGRNNYRGRGRGRGSQAFNKATLKRLRETLFTALILQDTPFFDTEAVGDLTSRLGADCQRLSRVIGNDIHLILRYFLQGAGALISLMCLSWPLALSTLVICAVLSAIFVVYGHFRKKAAKLTQEYSASTNEVARETLSLMRTVRAYGTEEKEYERYEQWLNKLASVNIRESTAFGLWNLSFIGLYRSTQVFAVALGGLYILSGNISAEQLMKYVLFCEWLIYAAWRLEDNISSLLQSVGASEKVFHLMALLPSDQFLKKGIKLPRLVGKVDFVNVSFYYPSRSTVPALEHVNISVQPNEVVAIVGHSAGGKSTLVNLLLRLYEPTDGQIYFDGFPLQDLDVGWLRERIGFVGQEPHLFHMDIKSNICYGCSREITQEDVEWAAKQAHVHEFISSLPNGYETIVHDGLLSGGQKQRLAIARAIVRDPTLLILDEATSALDAENEYYITRVLHAFRNDSRAKRTVIIIAHRLSTVRAADKVIVMDSGRVVEIYFDHFPLQDLDVGWLRERIGFVGQEPHLFHMDIKSNICYGCSREITQEDVEWAAKQAHIHEFISSLPNSYDTIVHDGLLSGGQKQRLAIARAIVRDPTLLILDEVTSALDAENEYYITRVLHAFRNDSRAKRTVIIIAHRLSTVRAADKVIVMDNGRVVEVGNHTDLIHQSGHYARLVLD